MYIYTPAPGIAAAEAAASDLVEISPPSSARDRAPPSSSDSSAVRAGGASLSPDRLSASERAGTEGQVPLGMQREERREAGGGTKSPGAANARRKSAGSRQRLVAALLGFLVKRV